VIRLCVLSVVFSLAITLAVFGLLCVGTAYAQVDEQYTNPYGARAEVGAYVDELVAEHGFERAELETLIAQAQLRTDIIERISKPAEKVWTWGRYKALLVGPDRVAKGIAFRAEHAQVLERAADTYGVAPEYIVAILGVETLYGEVKGKFRVLDALATLGFDYPPRAKFFRKELTQFLLLAREEGKDPTSLMGSYAGAMGYGQFIPSSYRNFAVDFDGDGTRDIWHNTADAVGSIANYFARHKWRGDGPVAVRIEDPQGKLAGIANKGLKLRHKVADIEALGLQLPADLAETLTADTRLAAYVLQGEEGVENWLGFHDFYAITRYNHSHLYALAIEHLARGVRDGYAGVSLSQASAVEQDDG